MSCYQVERRFPRSASIDPETQIGYVYKLAAGEEGTLVGVASQDMSLRLIDLERMEIVSQIGSAHASTITDLQHVPGTASGFISASNDGSVKVWDLRFSDPVVTIKLSSDFQDAPVFAASVSPNRTTCAAACGPNISLFKYGEWKKYFEYSESHFDNVSCMHFVAAQPDVLVSGADDGMVNIFNTTDLVNEDNGQCAMVTLNVGESVRSVNLKKNDKMLVFSTSESVSVWNPSTGGKVRPDVDYLRSHPLIASEETGWGYLLPEMNSDGSRLLAGNSTGTLVEFDTDNFEIAHIFPHIHTGVVRSACYLAPSSLLLTAGEDGFLYSWKVVGHDDGETSVSKTSIRSNRSSVSSRPY